MTLGTTIESMHLLVWLLPTREVINDDRWWCIEKNSVWRLSYLDHHLTQVEDDF